MKKCFLTTVLLLLTGCSTKYYDSIKEINQEIAESNARQAEACVEGLQGAETEAARLAMALTVCQNRQSPVNAAPPEKASEIIRALFSGLPFIGYFFQAPVPERNDYYAGGDITISQGDMYRSEEVIMPVLEEE